MSVNNFSPVDGRVYPRFSGIKTFYRLPFLPDEASLQAADVALLGAPFDGGTSYRPGARFGPEKIRSMSSLGRGHHPEHDVNIFKGMKVGDAGDCPVTPQDISKTHAQIKERVAEVLKAGTFPMVVGGDHSTTIGTLDALVAHHGPLGIIHFDAHTDTYPAAWGCDVHHGTFMRLGKERGWFRENAVVQVGIRGPFSTEQDIHVPTQYGYRVFTVDDVKQQGVGAVVQHIQQLDDGPFFISFDIDCLDPSCAPGTGTPVPGGLSTWEAQQILRATSHINVVGADLVEVSPPYDHHDITALTGVTVIWEILSAVAARLGK
ncbi:MAG: agmatinase [Myxococcales bacterium]|nr:agmatinase [Myxococcales bacterium]|tara:strand:+ start:516 stop:1472 length:957 start_codon:yes stop_codon:yes gene_type:complete